MAADLGVQFFATAKAQYESAGKWRLIVVVAIAYLHVALVMPFAEQMSEKSLIDRDIAGYRAAESALMPVLAATADIANRLNSRANAHAEALRDDLVRRFANLSTAVNSLAFSSPDAAGGAPSPSMAAPPILQMQQVPVRQQIHQMPLGSHTAQGTIAAPGRPTPRSIAVPLPSELRVQITDGSAFPGRGEVSPEFAAYIETAIIGPAFQNANDAWRASVLPVLKERAGRLDGEIKDARAEAQSAGEQLDSLAVALAELRAEAEKLTFAPPSDPRWWRTVESKESSIRSMIDGFQRRVGDIDKRQHALTELQAKATEIVSQKEKAIERINTALDALDKRATDLQSQLGELGGPLKVVNFKLSQLAPLMPLIVGLALAGIAVWTAEGLRRMSLAARLATDGGEGRVIRTWLASAAGGSAGKIVALELFLAILSVGWILSVARTVSTLAVPFLTPRIVAGGAVAAVLAARLYHWYRAGEALAGGRD